MPLDNFKPRSKPSDTTANIVLVAGASGVLGRRVCQLLVQIGHRVIGTTRSPAKAPALRALGVKPLIVDVFDEDALHRVVAETGPEIVIHQLTDLPPGLDPARLPAALVRTARLRDLGTRHLVAAAVAAGAKRFIAQSIAFAYAPGPEPYPEEANLNIEAPDLAGLTARGVANLERQVLEAPLEGIVLRYGRLYGPGTGFDLSPGRGGVHLDSAADATRRAISRGTRGTYNVAEDDGMVSIRKAVKELGWSPRFRDGSVTE